MNGPTDRSLEERVGDLERSVAKLETTLRELIETLARRERQAPQSPSARSSAPPGPVRRPRPGPATTKVPAPAAAAALGSLKAKGMGFWLGRIGIGLLLLGVAFLFKYAVDVGWLTPHVRIALGLALGAALVFIGLRVEGKQPWFAPLMLGGASATFYITGFAAFQLLALVGYATAFVFMIAVTLYTFWAAMHSGRQTLAVLGALGGLGTPFLLYTDRGSVAGLVMYTCLVLAGTSAIFMRRGWLALLWTSVFGAWSVIAIGLQPWVAAAATDATRADRWALQVGALVALLAFWALPVTREVLSVERPDQWPNPPRERLARMLGMPEHLISARTAQMLALAIPVIAFFFSREVWPYSNWVAAAVAAGLAATLLGAWWRLAGTKTDPLLRSIHAVAASVMLTVALQYALRSHTLIVTWSVEMLALHVVARRLDDTPLRVTAYLLSTVVVTWLAVRLAEGLPTTAVFNARALGDVVVIGAIAATASYLAVGEGRRLYFVTAWIALLAWLWRELSGVPGGHGFVTISWGIVASALLLAGLLRDDASLRRVGLATFLAVVVKLFLVDLSRLDPIWRILLFLGFGGLFLLLSYYFPALWRERDNGKPQTGNR